jgi:hypothetical protein
MPLSFATTPHVAPPAHVRRPTSTDAHRAPYRTASPAATSTSRGGGHVLRARNASSGAHTQHAPGFAKQSKQLGAVFAGATVTDTLGEPPDPAFTEPYSFLNLARAEFPDGWKSPAARVQFSDSPLDLALMAWFMRKIAMAIDTPMPGTISYDAFIALCFVQMKGRDPNGQRDITLGIMKSLMPPGGDKVFRALFPTSKWSLELNAAITKVVFAWMVGPMEVQSTAENDLGEEMLSKVHITKCRWLQESGCTGMCVNMCKTATQDFFCNDFGLPLTIKPNAEDMSCDFYFGLTPPPIEEDEALTFSCTSTCSTAVVRSRHGGLGV